MAERLKAHAWKACVGLPLPRVRIPPSPPPGYARRQNLGARQQTMGVTLFTRVDKISSLVIGLFAAEEMTVYCLAELAFVNSY